jgi:hypothetical protein
MQQHVSHVCILRTLHHTPHMKYVHFKAVIKLCGILFPVAHSDVALILR